MLHKLKNYYEKEKSDQTYMEELFKRKEQLNNSIEAYERQKGLLD